jgi:hypothetical protein
MILQLVFNVKSVRANEHNLVSEKIANIQIRLLPGDC